MMNNNGILRNCLLSTVIAFGLALTSSAQVFTTSVGMPQDTVNVERYDDQNLRPLIGRTAIVPFFNKEGTKFWYSWQDYGNSREEYHVYELGKGKYTIADTKDFEQRKYPKINPYGTSPDSIWRLSEDSLNNLCLENLQTHHKRTLTTDGAADYKFEIIDTHWLDHDYFIIMRKDTRGVRRFSMTYSVMMPPTSSDYIYEIPGDSIVESQQLYLGNLRTGSLQLLDTRHWRWQQLQWQKAEGVTDRVYFWRKKRTRDEAELCVADTTGLVRVVIHEESHPRINPDMFACHIIDGKHIFLWSDRTGWGHYYHYNTEGKLLNPISQGEWTCGRIVSFDTKRQQLFLEGYGKETGRNPNYRHIYRIGFNGKGLRLVTPEDANHNVFIGPNQQLIVDTWSRINVPPTVCVRDRNGKLLQEIEHVDISRLTDYGWRCPEPIQLTAADGITPLYGIMWKPFDFDPNKKYPIISQVYPGPFTETVWNDFTVFDKYHNGALAQRGFIVVVFGHRGSSPYRSKAYNTYGYGNLRDYPLADDVAGLRDLFHQYSFIDSTRVGIMGHSGGAMMAATALMTYPDFYKAAVASSGNYDNRIYNRTWGENYQGIDENGHFEVKTVMELAPRLKGKLFIATGDRDQNVHPAHTQRLVEALIQANKDFELLILPGQEHHYDFKHEQYFERRKRDFFERALK